TLRTLPGAAPGTVAPPTGEFGPPPRMDAGTANDGTANDGMVNEGSGSGGGAAAGAVDTSAETSEGERRDEAAT
ncbi:hypothetical protein, partial [Streptomyces rochei]